jgi:hypothetical protein
MSKYGSCITFGRACSYEKDEIKHALNGEVLVAWDENGRHWEKGTKEETDKVILKAFDSLFYQADQLRMSGCALEKMNPKYNKRDFQKYLKHMAEESRKPNDYEYEHWEDE